MKNYFKTINRSLKVDEEKKTCVYIMTAVFNSSQFVQDTPFSWSDLSKVMDKMKLTESWSFTVVGKSKCHDDDVFDREKGIKIARLRAKEKLQRKIEKIYYNLAKHLYKSAKFVTELTINANNNAVKYKKEINEQVS